MGTRCLGVDVGTGYISSAEKGKDPSKVEFRKCRDAFFKPDLQKFMGGVAPQFAENMLKQQKAHFIKINQEIYILGDSAFKFATTMHQNTLRPMKRGILNPQEKVSAMMVTEIIKAISGPPVNPETDVLFYCIPADPIDSEMKTEYHKEVLKQVFNEMGYKNVTCIHEGLAVVFSELSNDNFTGIGISFGAGMVNTTLSFMGMPLLSFSISRGGDWIDEESAKVTNEKSSILTYKKESVGVDIRTPRDEYERAISIHYRALLKYLTDQIKILYKTGLDMNGNQLPMLMEPLPVVVAGGTTLIGGFVETFEDVVKKGLDGVIPIKEVRKAEEPLFAVSHGLLQAARLNSGTV
jgi:actin-like ATPase involved in cell morphogenesis